MKWQFKFMRYALSCAVVASSAIFAACDGGGDEPPQGPVDPSADLVIMASRDKIVVGEQNVYLRAMNGKYENVTSETTFRNVTTGETLPGTAWMSDKEGSYEFEAIYNGMVSEKKVTVKVVAAGDTFYQRVLLTKFTGVGCAPCAQAELILENVVAEDPDRLVQMAVHCSIPSTDPFVNDDTYALQSLFNVNSAPTWYYDFFARPNGSITLAGITRQIEAALSNHPTTCGIKASSTLSGSKAKITPTVKFVSGGEYKITCVLQENLLPYGNKSFSNVMRKYASAMPHDDMPTVADGEERSFSFEVAVQSGWKASNLEFIVYVWKEIDKKFIVVNSIVCPVQGEVGYLHNPAE